MKLSGSTLWLFTILIAGYLAAAGAVMLRSTAPTPDRRVTLRIAHWQLERGPSAAIDEIIRRYEEINPRVKVEQMRVPASLYRQWLRSNLAGGTCADVLEFGRFLGGVDDVPARFFEPLGELLAQPNPYNRNTPLENVPWRETFLDGLWGTRAANAEAGELYAVTLTQNSLRLFCNYRLLTEVWGDRPVPRDMDEFRELCAAVAAYKLTTGRNIHTLAGSREHAAWIIELLMASVVTDLNYRLDRDGLLNRNNRQSLMDLLEGRWDFNRPELRAAFSLVREVCLQMRPGFMQIGRDAAVQEFVQGEALFIFGGTWDATSLRQAAPFPIQVERFPVPARTDSRYGHLIKGRVADGMATTGFEIYLYRGTPHREEAVDFLRFLTSVEAGTLFARHSGWLSSIRGVFVPPDMEACRVKADGYCAGVTYLGHGPESQALLQRNLHLLVAPNGGVEEFTKALGAGYRDCAERDLQAEWRLLRERLRRSDCEILAPGEAARRTALISSQNATEMALFEMQAVILHAPSPPR